MTRYTTPTNTIITTTKKLGEGGEGAVFDVAGQSALVAKIYHPARLNASLAAKVIAMTRNPPEDATRASLNHVSIAWPTDVLYAGKQFVGYTMPKIKKSDDLYDLLQPQQRAKEHSSLNHRHLYRTARNLAIAMDAIHRKGYVVGDVNFKNALFNDDALITMVDCDSMQVTDSAGVVHHCLVGVPEYTPADLQGKDFSRVTRTPNHDAFGLAILIFQMLMQGFHPFAGRPKPGVADVEQAHIYCISKGIFPYLAGQSYEPPPAAPSMLCLPVLIQQQFERAFTQPTARPTPKDWANVLAMVETRLVPCPNDPSHWYPSDGHCVICEIDYNVGRRQRTSPKPSATVHMQVPLPATPTSSTGPLRPSAISKPHVSPPSPQTATVNKPAVPRSAPVPPVAPPSSSRPTQATPTVRSQPVPTQTLPPLVSPNPARQPPRSTPTVPAPQPGRSVPFNIIATLSTYVQQHRMVVIPIAVIFMALLIFLVSTMNSGNMPSPSTTMLPTDSSAEIVVDNTQIPVSPATTIPATTATQSGEKIECNSANVTKAMWPMLSDQQYKDIAIKQFTLSLKSYQGSAVQIQTKELSSDRSSPTISLEPNCKTGKITLNNPLLPSDPNISSHAFLCTGEGCKSSPSTPLLREYSLVFTKTSIGSSREIDPSNALLYQFFVRISNPKIEKVLLISNQARKDALMEGVLTPFVRNSLISINLGNVTWLKGTTIKVGTKAVLRGNSYFNPITGTFQHAAEDGDYSWISRRIPAEAFSTMKWRNGTKLSAKDYANWWQQNSNLTSPIIESVSTPSSGALVINYSLGVTQDLADRIVPLPMSPINGADIYSDSTSDWLITKTESDTYAVKHLTDSRKTFNVNMVDERIFASSLPINWDADVMIIDASISPRILSLIAGSDIVDYKVFLVPTGSVFTHEE